VQDSNSTPVQLLGNAPRTICCGPGISNFDFSVQKFTPLRERIHLEFRADFFNLFNHTQFLIRMAASRTERIGRVKRTRDPRQVQFALKLALAQAQSEKISEGATRESPRFGASEERISEDTDGQEETCTTVLRNAEGLIQGEVMYEALQKEIAIYEKRSPKSAAAHKRALERIPLGVAAITGTTSLIDFL